MSRVGKKPITIPSDVKVEVKDGLVLVKGKKGVLQQAVDTSIKIEVANNEIAVVRSGDDKQSRAFHGLYRALINNMVVGVTTGYKVDLELVGVGYKASNTGNILELNLGYSHDIYFQIPSELKLTTETLKGKNPTITLEGIDKQLIGQVAAELRRLRKVEPYKGKGVRFVNEVVRRKAGKTAGK